MLANGPKLFVSGDDLALARNSHTFKDLEDLNFEEYLLPEKVKDRLAKEWEQNSYK